MNLPLQSVLPIFTFLSTDNQLLKKDTHLNTRTLKNLSSL